MSGVTCPYCAGNHSLSQCPHWTRNCLRRSAILLAACLAVGPAPALTTADGRTVTLDDDEVRACRMGGGCVLVPKAQLDNLIERAEARATAQHARTICGNRL